MEKDVLEKLKQKYEVGDDDLKPIIQDVFNKLTYRKVSQNNPIAIVVAGQPGAGKSGLINKTLFDIENSVVMDVDDFRYFHPQIEEILKKYPNDLATFTISFVNRIFRAVLPKLMEQKYNLIMQKTLRDDEVIDDTLKPLSEAGYTIILRVLAVSELESKLSTLERSLAVKRTVGYCRWTPLKNQDYALNGLLPTTKDVFDSDYCDAVQIFKRDNIPSNSKLIYSKVKELSSDKIKNSLKLNKGLIIENYGLDNYIDEIDAIKTTRERVAQAEFNDIVARMLMAKRVIDEEGLKYLLELEELVTDYYLKINDFQEDEMNNNIKLELAKEIMARKIAIACKNGFTENEELKSLLEEEREMNKFNINVIEKIINVYGKEIKIGENR